MNLFPEGGIDSNWFKAKYSGFCRACNSKFSQSDNIKYNSEGELVAWDCCKGLGTLPEFEGVMPTGKTRDDRCPRCFMIHSTAQEDCE